ncbi:MAG: adenosylcobinamide amidohydrolase [Desulfarculaceae bacterium]|jgi:adenosylcobinamide amidohydrolase
MLLGVFYDALELQRRQKIIIARFLKPHKVISTCRAAGGLRDDLSCVYNHQACEPTGHHRGMPVSAWSDPIEYRRLIAEQHHLEAKACATLGTAANMNNAAVCEQSFREQTVVAVATGGVETNAGRIGDPAFMYEHDGQHQKLNQSAAPEQGTINTMLFINKELTPGAMVRTIMTATEAKTAVLQELAVNSRYSNGLATGTGTDQIAVSCMQDTGTPLTGAGKHSKLGELIGRAVYGAIKKTLAVQNELTPAGQGSARIHLERFGAGREEFLAKICSHLNGDQAKLLKDNYDCINRDPMTVAAVAALVHLRDKLTWGVLPAECQPEIMASYAAQVAAAVSGKYELINEYREILAPTQDPAGDQEFLDLVCRAFAQGFAGKWDFTPCSEEG